MNSLMKTTHEPAERRYGMLRVALELFGKPPLSLSAEEQRKVEQQVNRELSIGKRVLAAKEAAEVVIPESVVMQAVDVLAKRYDSEKEFLEALDANCLDRNSLFQALQYELRVEAALERIVADRSAVSDTDVEIYYLQHLDKFVLPETRTARHILITINDEYDENRRERAMQRITELQNLLLEQGEEFSALAQRHSECPTAMQEGLLGRIKQGRLFPELDERLFAMESGELSEIIESPVGLHLLLCEEIHAAERRRFSEVKEKLRDHLETKKRKHLLNVWLRSSG